MKCVSIIVQIDCPDDIPEHVIEWMGDNLGEHAAHEFGRDYEPDWFDGYEGPPVAGHVVHAVRVHPRSGTYAKAVAAELKATSREAKASARRLVELARLRHAVDAAAEKERENMRRT